jgi:alkylation response protein AidB-like acyl-CoA dehydrogenase
MLPTEGISAKSLRKLKDSAAGADGKLNWPESSWQALVQSDAVRGAIPREFGGLGWEGIELLLHYEQLAAACLTSCFILSQRDAAVRRLCDSANQELVSTLLADLAAGQTFTTVGLSQLTTSRQHSRPALTAHESGGDFVLNGFMPWVTGAVRADFFVTGAVLEDGRQILGVLPRDRTGVTVGPPASLMALQGSMTAEVRCEQVRLERRLLLAGPVEKVMAGRRGGTGGIETSCLALGLTTAAVQYLQEESATRPDLKATAERLEHACNFMRSELHSAATHGCNSDAAATLRGRANTLVLRATQAALTAGKGAGFLLEHPAQRWARQALFFLVWSCPRPAVEATMAYFCDV